jgi:hypothetical protein
MSECNIIKETVIIRFTRNTPSCYQRNTDVKLANSHGTNETRMIYQSWRDILYVAKEAMPKLWITIQNGMLLIPWLPHLMSEGCSIKYMAFLISLCIHIYICGLNSICIYMYVLNFASASMNLLFFFPRRLHFMQVVCSASMHVQLQFCLASEYVMCCCFWLRLYALWIFR